MCEGSDHMLFAAQHLKLFHVQFHHVEPVPVEC